MYKNESIKIWRTKQIWRFIDQLNTELKHIMLSEFNRQISVTIIQAFKGLRGYPTVGSRRYKGCFRGRDGDKQYIAQTWNWYQKNHRNLSFRLNTLLISQILWTHLYPFITFWIECVATTLKSHVKRSSGYAF